MAAKRNYAPIRCAVCGKEFVPRMINQSLCSECSKKNGCRKPVKHKSNVRVADTRPGEHPRKHYAPIRCARCGKEFTPRQSTQRFCSERCGRAYYATEHYVKAEYEPIACAVCGKMFTPHHKRTVCCSDECKKTREASSKSRGPTTASVQPNRVCVICGKKFYGRNSVAKTCSAECRLAHKRQLTADWAKKHNPDINDKYILSCDICGRMFPSRTPRAKYCSEKCRMNAQKSLQKKKSKPHETGDKSLEQWALEAARHGMSYGQYRAALAHGWIKR